MASRSLVALTLLGLGLAFATSAGLAQPDPANVDLRVRHAQPGSVLIFPLYDSTPGNNTLISVTNLNESEVLCDNGLRQGDVQLHYNYFSEVWEQSDSDEDLTPADTITVLARGHNPNPERGFLVVESRDPETNLPIDYDFLIGSAIIVNSEFDFQWAYTPYAFEGLPLGNRADGAWNSACGFPIIDLPTDPDFDTLDFDGDELSFFPQTLYIDHFFGEGTPASFPGVTFSNTLHLMSTSPGGPDVDDMTEVSVVGYNNNERLFSRTFRFNCYISQNLDDITNATSQAQLATGGDSDELLGVSYGWLRMHATNEVARGASPFSHAILGVFSHQAMLGAEMFVAGRELQYTGSRRASLPRGF